MDSGWFGNPEQLLYVLSMAGADKDEQGNFLVYGEPVFRGLDGDVVVSQACECSIKGRRVPIVGLMSATSYGIKVCVI